ncbi:MAG: TIGR00282 family metallophosphoesterase [Pseudomonadota bacterium]
MRIGFFGDVMGRSGRKVVLERLPKVRDAQRLDFVVVNAENAAGGFGVTERIAGELFDAGADVLTTGNHAYDQRESLTYYEREERLLRPINYPASNPGRGSGVFQDGAGRSVLVVNVMCQRYMGAPVDDPFAAVDREIIAAPLGEVVDAALIDVHGEATSEKAGLGHFLDGRASIVVGTHTHIPTADDQILPRGTAYQTDAGMCGAYDSIIGMDKEEPLQRFVTKMPSARMTPADGPGTLSGLIVETDDATGLAVTVDPIRLGGALRETAPET